MDDGGGRTLRREAWPEITGPGLTPGSLRAAGNLETEDSRTHTAEERRDR